MLNSKRKITLLSSFSLIYVIGLFNGVYNSLIANDVLLWAIDILEHAIVPMITLIFVIRYVVIIKINPTEKYDLAHLLIYSLMTTVSLLVVFVISNILCYQLGFWETPTFTYNSIIGENFVFLQILYLALSAGVFEEIFYRSLLYTIIKDYFAGSSNVIFIITSSLLFATIHWEGGIQSVIVAFSFGLVAAYLYVICGHLVPLIIGHFLLDFFVFYYPEGTFYLGNKALKAIEEFTVFAL